MLLSVAVCLLSFVFVIAILRAKQASLGLPIAYLGSLLLIHVPGAVAHLFDARKILTGRPFTEVGIAFTAIGATCFVIGVAIAHAQRENPVVVPAPRTVFWNFCLFGGILLTTISYLVNLPTIGAILQKSGPVWMLAVMLGLRSALQRRDVTATWRWLLTLGIYPLMMLLLGGFLSYGSTASIIVLSAVAVRARSRLRVALGTGVVVFMGISVFLGYFENRSAIRAAVWGGEATEARIDASLAALEDVSWFNPEEVRHLQALDARLNQNYFAGIAAARIATGAVDYLYGQSLLEGAMAVVPRALWPGKPVVAGSPKIVAQMTGLKLSTTTSFGVGNVMEFHINFGIPGLIIGFVVLGFLIGRLDRLAAESEAKGDLGRTILFFLPCVAMIQPNGSVVEIMSGAAAAAVAGLAWQWTWSRWPKPTVRRIAVPNQLARSVS